jgi:hypothetical protein
MNPGCRPWENRFTGSFSARLGDEVMEEEIFYSLGYKPQAA